MHRRQFLATSAVIGLAGCTFHSADTSPTYEGPQVILEPVLEGLHYPTAMAFLPDESRLICEREGQIYHHSEDGIPDEPLVDISDRMAPISGERGLIGLESHPNFPVNQKFYVRYSGHKRDWMPQDYSHTAVLSEFKMNERMTQIKSGYERIILEMPQPGNQHQAGDLAFGPDGFLYASFGDGKGYDTIEDDSWYWWNEDGDASQNTTDNLLGGILRIDVNSKESEREYSIPPDNPLVGKHGQDEYFAWGFRNPYRISFDDGRLFVGDVGLGSREEINIVKKGGNYGWPVLEGNECARSGVLSDVKENVLNAFHPRVWLGMFNLLSPRKLCPEKTDRGRQLIKPVINYQRSGGRAVVGGYVYRGQNIPELQGSYIFGDYRPPSPIFAAKQSEEVDKQWSMAELDIVNTDSGRLSGSILSFARDAQGRVYVLSTQFGEGTGSIYRISGVE